VDIWYLPVYMVSSSIYGIFQYISGTSKIGDPILS